MPTQKSKIGSSQQLIPVETIADKIFLIRGEKVMLDRDLAQLYGVPTKVFNQAVRRNRERFPDDFMFQLNREEALNLRSQFVTSKWGGRRYLPYVFTEQGVAMLSSVLHSNRAIQVNIAIMRTFVRVRGILSTHKDLARKLEDLERKYATHDVRIQQIFFYIKKLMTPPRSRRRQIGFLAPEGKK